MSSSSSTPTQLTPSMAQYMEVKGRYQDCLLFFRMGDFYELFFEDAVTAAKILDIALTARNRNESNPIPMCGVPFHAATSYINKAVAHGYKVAVCEQLEDPSTVKGIVKRDVVQVVTPGAQFDLEALDSKSLNITHCACIEKTGASKKVFFGSCDFSTGYMVFGSADSVEQWQSILKTQNIAEILLPEDESHQAVATQLRQSFIVQLRPEFHFDLEFATQRLFEQFETQSLSSLHSKIGIQKAFVKPLGALVRYFQDTQLKGNLRIPLVNRLRFWNEDKAMDLDGTTIEALELLPKKNEDRQGTDKHSLFSLLDHNHTAAGARLLKQWLIRPLSDLNAILRRLDCVEFMQRFPLQAELGTMLSRIYDLERLTSKLALGTANARDLRNLCDSLTAIEDISNLLLRSQNLNPAMADLLTDLNRALSQDLKNLAQQTAQDLVEAPPLTLREGGLFRRGVHADLDELITLTENGAQWLVDFEAQEKQATGINSLKVRFNKVFGYYIEVTKANVSAVPGHYIRKQTMVNGERYITDELKKFEDKILNAEKRRQDMELEMFKQRVQDFLQLSSLIASVAEAIAKIDIFQSFAMAAQLHHYCRPEILESDELDIVDGRHPMVEVRGGFVANSIQLGGGSTGRFMFITGPNMGGKSTIMRQAALITLMAQMGCYVPATQARIGIVDRIFTRIGAADNIAEGQSTFMVEMSEMSAIIRNASAKSLILLDEVGRGTSTYDGLSLAWALAEEIIDQVGARTMFATHYHEITELATHRPEAFNMQVAVDCREGEDVRFLYKLDAGAARKSYGISVAKLAGIPPRVLKRAETLLARLELQKAKRAKLSGQSEEQLGLDLL